ncbi:FACR259Wp [Eremothecium gossypii FDAG1]|nr:FACR259Wp [Eremothecium gossypii FDAG1]
MTAQASDNIPNIRGRRPRGVSDRSGAKLPQYDPGSHPPGYFKPYMSAFRFKCREYLLPFTANQSDYIALLQRQYRTPWRDSYFAYTALLGSHMFYVIALPIPRWLGYGVVTRDLVYVLGYSIYITGYLKDYFCLPRPASPPCHRIALSKYTTKEYGAPSSHCANATAVTLLFLVYAWRSRMDCSALQFFLCLVLLAVYYVTLTLGRIYCGMHGLLDIVTGSAIGVFCFTVRLITRDYLSFDQATAQFSWWFPFFAVAIGLLMLFYHVEPVDPCPCFEDSVAFIGVITGIEAAEWLFPRLFHETTSQYLVFQWSYVAIPAACARIVAGILCVLLWKSVLSKKLVYSLLSVLMTDDRPAAHAEHPRTGHVRPLVPRIDILGRFFVYMGVPMTVIIVCPTVFALLGI